MPNFAIPAPPADLNLQRVRLAVRCNFDLDAGEYEELRRSLAGSERSYHLVLRQAVSFGGDPAELSALIGLHAAPDTPKEGEERPPRDKPWLHYRIDMVSAVAARQVESEGWVQLAEAAERLIPEHSSRVKLNAELGSEDVALGVRLPIQLGQSEVAGFSTIRGVRLVQPDPQNPEHELYSLVLDQWNSTVGFTVNTFAEARFDQTVLVKALDRALSVLRLGVSRKGK